MPCSTLSLHWFHDPTSRWCSFLFLLHYLEARNVKPEGLENRDLARRQWRLDNVNFEHQHRYDRFVMGGKPGGWVCGLAAENDWWHLLETMQWVISLLCLLGLGGFEVLAPVLAQLSGRHYPMAKKGSRLCQSAMQMFHLWPVEVNMLIVLNANSKPTGAASRKSHWPLINSCKMFCL